MKKMKKLLLLMAVVTTALVCFALSASAKTVPASGKCGDNVTYTYNSTTGELVISGTGPMRDYDWDNSPFSYTSIKSVIINDGVTTIGDEAFVGCDSLAEVTIGDSVTTIGNYAFSSCYSLAEVTIGNSVTTIGNQAFYSCESLTEVTIPDSVTTIGKGAFSSCESLTEVTIPDSVTTIGNYAFEYCNSLTEVTIGDSVTTIGDEAFGNCKSLTEVTIPDSVTIIGDYAFYDCNSLTEVTIPDSVTTIGDYAFCSCDSLTEITIPDSVTTIGDQAFSDSHNLTEVTIGDNVTTIGDYAFCSCGSLTEVTIGNSVTTIGDWAFCYCGSLTDVYYGGTQEQWEKISIGEKNSYLTGATIHYEYYSHSHTDADSDKFCDVCKKYTEELYQSGPFGDNVTYEWYADGVVFINGTGPMTDFPSYNSSPFYRAEVNSVVIGEGVTTVGKRAFYECKMLKRATIPDSVTLISDYAFANCDGLTSAPMGKNVTRIGEGAFSECDNLVELTIGDKVTSIGELAFLFCRKLPSVTIPENVISIEDGAFENCEKITNVTINGRLETIVDNTFYNCDSLECITLPDSITEIGERAFIYCTGLKDVYFGGTEDQWNKITILAYNEDLTNATIHFALHSHTDTDSDKFCDECKEYTEELYKSGSCGDNVTYEWYADGTVIICGEGAMTNYSSSSSTPFYNSNIKKVIIGDGVTSVGRFAFDCCQSLTDVIMGDDVTIIGWNAFEACNSLVNISLSDELTTIEGYAFAFCDSLSDILIPDTVTRIDDAAFIKCKSLKSITIPDGMSEINAYTFYYCKNLTSITIPDNVTAIGDYAFYGCDNLSGITVSDSVTTIGSNAFQNCYNLTDVYYAGTRNQWQEITIGSNNDYLTDATIHFNGCSHINATEYPQQNPTCASVGYTAGRYCIDCDMWLSGHEEIPAINHKNKETHPQYSPSCVAFGYTAGTYCPDCKTWLSGHEVIPATNHANKESKPQQNATCTAKGYTAGTYCPDCEKWLSGHEVIPATNHKNKETRPQQNATCTANGYTAGTYCPDCEKWLSGHDVISAKGHTDTDSDKFCDDCGKYTEKLYKSGSCGDNVTYEWYEDGTVFISGSGAMMDYENFYSSPFYYSNIKSVVINEGVTTIGDYAFYWCESLTEVTIGDSVTTIGDYAFYWCESLTEVTIGDSVTTIGDEAFRYCDSLTEVTIGDSVKTIGDHAFQGCYSLTEVTIPDSVTTIGEHAFAWCHSLTEVTIGDGVTTIGAYAFDACGSLTDVYYGGTQEQWIKIKIGSYNGDLTSANIHYNYCPHTDTDKTYYPQQNPTCTGVGYTAGVYCNICQRWSDGHEKIKAKGHTYTEKIIDSAHLKSKATVEKSAVYKYDCANCDSISPDKTFTHGNTLALGVTPSVTATQTTSSLTLTWDKAPNATGYRLYYKLPGDMSWRASVSYTTATTVTYSNLPAGQAYRFAIRSAYKKADGTYILGGYKEIATATKAVAPANVDSLQNASSIRLNWTACPGATGYRIYYKSGNAWKICVSTTAATAHTFSGLKSGAKYTFAVRPYILVEGVVIWSNYITITTATQTISPVVTATSTSSGRIDLSWKAVNGAEAYQVYYKVGNGNYKLYKTYTSVQSLKFANLKSGTKYTFAVRGVIKGSEENIYGFHNPVTVTVR